ncbi:transposon protein [Striga asiatica]|uniref:Transposon protein n=1 Tax=Striga asiatica TaxID=4170 RepID=A0A5A7Q7M7_STRAF|nr:transposon protein [Striga asiatica]
MQAWEGKKKSVGGVGQHIPVDRTRTSRHHSPTELAGGINGSKLGATQYLYTLASLKKDQQDQKEQKEALLLLDAMELPDSVYKVALKKILDTMAFHMFLNMANDWKRRCFWRFGLRRLLEVVDDDMMEIEDESTGPFEPYDDESDEDIRRPFRESSITGMQWVNELLEGNPTRFYHAMELQRRGVHGLYKQKKVCIEESVGIFLHAIRGHQRHRRSGETSRRSNETISRHCHIIITALADMGLDYILPPDVNRHGFPVVIEAYRCRKGYLAQNMMVSCDFDLKFTFVLAGWEGSANDALNFKDTLSNQGINSLPTTGLILCARFWAFKPSRFFGAILQQEISSARVDGMVVACCVLHNFILTHQEKNTTPTQFLQPDYVRQCDADDMTLPFMDRSHPSAAGEEEQCTLRDRIATALWENHVNDNR